MFRLKLRREPLLPRIKPLALRDVPLIGLITTTSCMFFIEEMEGSDEEKTTNKTEEKQEDAEKDFEDIQLDIDTDVAKYSHEKESPLPRENGKYPENVITDQPVDATPPPSYANDVTVHGLDPPVVRQGPLKPKPKDFVVTSCFVILCCNFIFGLLGYHFGGKH